MRHLHQLAAAVVLSALVGTLTGSWLETQAQRKGLLSSDECNELTSCRPWEIQSGPFCARGNKIGLRFFLDLAEEERHMRPKEYGGYQRCGINTGKNTSVYVTFPFCPKVDELQAFSLNNSGSLAGTYNNGSGDKFSDSSPRYLRLYGFGSTSDVEFPQRKESQGAVVVVDVCPGKELQTAVVPFLVFNVSMDGGKLKYYSDFGQPGGTGFSPTCFKDSKGGDVCQLDASMKCIGDEGAKNCAVCYENSRATGGIDQTESLKNQTIRVWMSYYGTDRTGRQLRSGSNNPLNFRQYSGGGMYTSLSSSLNNVDDGSFEDPELDDPGTAGRKFSLQGLRNSLDRFTQVEAETLNPEQHELLAAHHGREQNQKHVTGKDAEGRSNRKQQKSSATATGGSRLQRHIATIKRKLQ